MESKFIYKSSPFWGHKVFIYQGTDNSDVLIGSDSGYNTIEKDRYLGERIYEDGKPFVSPDVIKMANRYILEGMNLEKWEYATFGDRPKEEFYTEGKYIV